jgi:Tol biopolymer transport system component
MPDLDDYLRNELRRIVRPVDVNDVSSKIDLRRTRRARLRKIQAVALTVVVLAGTTGGVVMLSNAFRKGHPQIGPAANVGNGVIVYSAVRNAGQQLWSVHPDGTGARQLTTGDGFSDTSPSVSPDGRTIAFTRTDEHGSAIFTIGIDGDRLKEFSPVDVSAVAPSWSPDGSQIAFAAVDGGIYIGSVDGSKPRLLQGRIDVATGLTWSPDGTKIAFSAPSEATGAQLNYDLWITSGTLPGVLAVSITPRTDASELSPAWSPDGSRILFSRSTPSGASLMLMAPETQATPTEVTDGTNLDQNPSWSPDGSLIVFDRTSAGGTDVFTIRPDGSDLTLVARNATDPAWQAVPSETAQAPSPTPTSEIPVNIDLGFPVCNVQVDGAGRDDFDRDGQMDLVVLATKLSDAGACPPQDQGFNVLAIANADGAVDASFGPIECPRSVSCARHP